MKKFKNIFSLALIVFTLVSCASDEGEGGENVSNFDRGALLINWADNIIIPSFQNFATYTTDLEAETKAFIQNPSEASLVNLRNSYEEAYIQFQTVAPFGVGMAETVNYRMFLNTYPVAAETMQGKIERGSFNLELPSSFAEQGFPALDFLLNGLAEQDTDIVKFYTTHPDASSYRDYLVAVSTKINKLTQDVLAHWKNSYRDVFVANTASSNTGSVDRFTNEYVMYYEKQLRTGKIGIPAGAFTGNPVPQNVEARYSEDLSKDLYLKALETVKNFFNGKHFTGTGTGPSYKQYLDHLNTVKNSTDLSNLINSQFNVIEEQANNLGDNFFEQVRSNNNVMLQAFDALQKNVVLLKVDMLQALSISVDYVDTDGD